MAKSKIYLKNADLYREIMVSKVKGELSKDAVEMLLLLTEKISTGFSYENLEDKNDCIAFAHYDLIKYWKSFDPEKSNNAFAYYTSIIRRGIYKGWNQLHPKKYHGTLRMNSGGSDSSDEIYSLYS